MGINSKIAKIPFGILYLISALVVSFNWIQVIMYQSSFEVFRQTQPWDYYLSKLFADTFGTTQKQYFIFAFPVVLVCLYLIPKLLGKLMQGSNLKNVRLQSPNWRIILPPINSCSRNGYNFGQLTG